jgi:hypothetical protein
VPAPRKYAIDPEWEAALRADPCAYCGAPARDLDHIVAVIREGEDGWENLASSCGHCNKEKHDESLLLFLWKRTLEGMPSPRSPRAGVHWRKDIKRWTAFVDLVRRYQLGTFPTAEAATAAVEAWWQANPDAMSPRARHTRERRAIVRRMWGEGHTVREIGAALGISYAAAVSVVNRTRAAEGLPYVGQGGPGKKRPPRARKAMGHGRGYSYARHGSRPWLVQVQSRGERRVERFATEQEAQAAVAAFRAEHPRKRRDQDGQDS